jgi:hypothetical protein
MGQEVKNSRSQEVEESGAAVVSLHRSQILSFPTRNELVASAVPDVIFVGQGGKNLVWKARKQRPPK